MTALRDEHCSNDDWVCVDGTLNLMIMLGMDSAEGAFGCRRPSLHPRCSGNRNPRPEMRSMWKQLMQEAILSALSIYYISLLLKLT